MRRLSEADLDAAARLHSQMADLQFIARGGPPLLRHYYRAWMGTGADISLGAFDGNGVLVGVLLGSVSPAEHYRAMLRRGGWRVALGMASAAVSNRSFAKELLRTRGGRYARALGRRAGAMLRPRRAPVSPVGESQIGVTADVPEPGAGPGGEVTHMVVDQTHRRTGAGRALVDAACELARQNRLSHMELVTVPGSGAAAFYDRLGWEQAGELSTASGEHFVRYRLAL